MPATHLKNKNISHKQNGKELKQLLVRLSEIGMIQRQEEVSAIPPYFLDISPHHRILDMCASPGSKTSQIIQFLHMNLPRQQFFKQQKKGNFSTFSQSSISSYQSSQDPILLPTGCLVANDVSKKRCYVLAKQLAQQQSPVLLITNHDATRFPFIADETEIFSQSQLQSKQQKGIFLFDRILCDVPCSGTGTLRKQKKIEHTFSPFDQLILHPIQMSILNRSIQLLREGGIVVYSTCSLCPLEDEAVVSAILLRWGKKVEIVDVQNHDEIVGYEQEQQQEERIQINEENKEDLYNNINETENGIQKQKKNNKMKNKNKNKEKVKKVLPLLKTEIGLSDWKVLIRRKEYENYQQINENKNLQQKEEDNQPNTKNQDKNKKKKNYQQQKEMEIDSDSIIQDNVISNTHIENVKEKDIGYNSELNKDWIWIDQFSDVPNQLRFSIRKIKKEQKINKQNKITKSIWKKSNQNKENNQIEKDQDKLNIQEKQIDFDVGLQKKKRKRNEIEENEQQEQNNEDDGQFIGDQNEQELEEDVEFNADRYTHDDSTNNQYQLLHSDPNYQHPPILCSMFPPSKQSEVNNDKMNQFSSQHNQLPLHRCIRIYPQLQDTGGFFIAVIRKRHQYEYEKEMDINMEQKENENENEEDFGMKQEKEKEIEQQKEIEVGDENKQIKVKKKKEKKQKLVSVEQQEEKLNQIKPVEEVIQSNKLSHKNSSSNLNALNSSESFIQSQQSFNFDSGQTRKVLLLQHPISSQQLPSLLGNIINQQFQQYMGLRSDFPFNQIHAQFRSISDTNQLYHLIIKQQRKQKKQKYYAQEKKEDSRWNQNKNKDENKNKEKSGSKTIKFNLMSQELTHLLQCSLPPSQLNFSQQKQQQNSHSNNKSGQQKDQQFNSYQQSDKHYIKPSLSVISGGLPLFETTFNLEQLLMKKLNTEIKDQNPLIEKQNDLNLIKKRQIFEDETENEQKQSSTSLQQNIQTNYNNINNIITHIKFLYESSAILSQYTLHIQQSQYQHKQLKSSSNIDLGEKEGNKIDLQQNQINHSHKQIKSSSSLLTSSNPIFKILQSLIISQKTPLIFISSAADFLLLLKCSCNKPQQQQRQQQKKQNPIVEKIEDSQGKKRRRIEENDIDENQEKLTKDIEIQNQTQQKQIIKQTDQINRTLISTDYHAPGPVIVSAQLQQKYGTPISFALSGVVTTQHALFLAGPQDLFDTLIPLIELVCITSEQNINVQEKKIRKTKK